MRRRFPAGVTAAFLLSGCLYTTQHFNTGRLLEPGHSSVTLGAGKAWRPEQGCPESRPPAGSYGYLDNYRDSTGLQHCEAYDGTFDTAFGNYAAHRAPAAPTLGNSASDPWSLGYRLGVHGPVGPISGFEIGLHLETPTNPITAEFDLKLGLPVPSGLPWHHSLSAGWGIGAWADNSYFLEYAVSRAFGAGDLFGNYRATYLSSQFADLKEAESLRHFDSHRRLIHQAAAGFKWTLPDLRVVPDFLIPEVLLTYPLAPADTRREPEFILDNRAWALSLGMGWHYK